MSAGPEPVVNPNQVEQARQALNQMIEEMARLSEQDLPPADYYGQFLQKVMRSVAAPAGAVWLRTPQGHLQLQFQINLRETGIDKSETERQSHGELLRQTLMRGQPVYVPPQSSGGGSGDGKTTAGNPTKYVILVAPIIIEKQVAGLVEIFQEPDRNPTALRNFMGFLGHMAGLAAVYTRNQRLRQIVGQQELWTQLEAFARQVHGSLHTTEVAYLVANTGRRIVECDRIAVAIRRNRRTAIEAISGADVVEKRSNLVQLMRKLADCVLNWGEKLVYSGTKDDTLPPDIVTALDKYLAESNSKLLVILPLRDEREKESTKPPRSALVMESFEPAVAPEQLVARLEVVGKHSASALYNSIEYRRIPMRWIWLPLAKVQDGLGGKTRAIMAAIGAALVGLTAALVLVPYPLKMDAKGQLLPEERRWIYSPVEAHVDLFRVGPGGPVQKDQSLVRMQDMQLELNLIKIENEIKAAEGEIEALNSRYVDAEKPSDRASINAKKKEKEATRDAKLRELNAMRARTNSDSVAGFFWLKSPITGTVLNSDFRETLTNRAVKPSDPILRVGNKEGPWEIELKIPQKHIGQILQAFNPDDPDHELDVDLLLLSAPTSTYKGKLHRQKIAPEAKENRDENNESEPVVLAWVRIEGDDIPKEDQLPETLLQTAGIEVHAKVRCGTRPMGYSLFYGVWEFLYEKVIFFF